MKNKGFIALVSILAILIGGAFLFANASEALAYHDSGYDDYYGDYYGYDDYGYDDDYYGYDDCYYGCDDYGYYDACDYGCGGYYDECDYGYCGGYEYDDCYSDCYDDCYYGYGCDEDEEEPIEIRNTNTNINENRNENINNIRINISNPGRSYDYDEPVRVREQDPLVCTPSSQSAGVNQSVSLRVSGGTGNYTWNAPGSQNLSGRGDSVSLRYPLAGLKTISVVSGNQTATCFVQVTGGQVLAEFIELPNTGAGGIHAILPNMLAIGGAILAGLVALVFFVRRAIIA